jgi:hypothetical protein
VGLSVRGKIVGERFPPPAADDLNSLDGTIFIFHQPDRSFGHARAHVIYILHFHCKSAIHLYNASAGWSHGDAPAPTNYELTEKARKTRGTAIVAPHYCRRVRNIGDIKYPQNDE